MDKEKLEKWLNKLAKAVKQLTNIEDFNENIELCTPCVRGISNVPCIQLYCGIQTIAEIFDLEVDIDEDEDRVIRTFMWKGVTFLQYDRKGECL